MTGGDAVVATLREHGVDTVFGVPGVHSLGLYDAIARDGGIRHVLARHEQGAGLMAAGYAQQSGRIGVASTISGPGVTNVATAMALAYADSLPLLVISSALSREGAARRRGELHELRDQFGVMEALAGWTRRADSADNVSEVIAEAIAYLTAPRPRGAYVEIPHDVLDGDTSASIVRAPTTERPHADARAMAEAVRLLGRVRRPLIVAGRGVTASGANQALRDLAERLGAPVLLGPKSHDVLPTDHPLVIGTCYQHAPAINELASTCDATLVVGSKLGAGRTDYGALRLPEPLIHIDVDRAEIGREYPVTVALVGDALVTLTALSAALPGSPSGPGDPAGQAARDAVTAARAASAEATLDYFGPSVPLLDGVRRALPRDAVIVADATILGYAAAERMPVWEPRTFIHDAELCSIGIGFPVALGAKVAAPERMVTALCGDGGFLLTATELATAVQEGINVIVVVFNDAAYTAVKQVQQARYEGRCIATDLRPPDYAAMAEAFGARGMRAANAAELEAAVREAATLQGPVVIEVALPPRT